MLWTSLGGLTYTTLPRLCDFGCEFGPLPDSRPITKRFPVGAAPVGPLQGATVGSGIVGLQLVWLLLVRAQAAPIVLQAIRLRLEALRLRAVQIHGAAAHGHLGLGHVAVVILTDGQGVAVLGPVAVWHVGVAGRAVVHSAGQAPVVVRQIGVAIVQAVVADVLALGRLAVGVVVGVVVGARQGGGGLRSDEAVTPVLHVAPVDGVGVAAERG